VDRDRGSGVNPHLDFLLSVLYDHDGTDLHPPHREDLAKSGITPETIVLQKIRDVPPHMIDSLLGFPAPKVRSALLFPFPDPAGGFMDHVRMKVFPAHKDHRGQTVKYLQPRRSGVRLYFPLATLDRVLHSDEPLYAIEGEKKALAVARLGLPAFGFCGIDGWHVTGTQTLLSDFDDIGLRGRIVDMIPDGDTQTNAHVRRSAEAFGAALRARGARVRFVQLPAGVKGIDDYLVREQS
jgi:hypothetical protein